MPIDIITFNSERYPKFQSEGFAAKFIFPFAQQVCIGKGYDIGCNRMHWALPGAIPIDITLKNGYDALNLPPEEVDFIFSSHCLEHLPDWVNVLDYWQTKIVYRGVLFLYLPDYSQEYWRPWNNRKHVNILTPTIIKDYLEDRGYHNIFASGSDLNNSFAVMAENTKSN